jgi:hypothetical protein
MALCTSYIHYIPFDILYGHLVIKWQLAYFTRFGILRQEKSGNPDPEVQKSEAWGAAVAQQ